LRTVHVAVPVAARTAKVLGDLGVGIGHQVAPPCSSEMHSKQELQTVLPTGWLGRSRRG
jgi:hypothetical protein